ncbi:MAG: DNA polymerase IV [Erysipelotrichaceae bacterium]|nr:DNA polymerase IV [Erysipelotrichaceae bacterium]MBQ1810436.1 DNA polymerase IV [Erysipelotrichaceae bacterium]MBQ5755812.1 DNA polymerase IV [Erysipelotrichaceae bacterium]MBR3151709.1 DNA polymerase IV [Erysipelotrichaceae bacterium]
MKRTIVHADLNHCYAQIEEMKFPALRDVPMAVGGHEESRHGIILAKNDKAKAYGIKTAETLRDAYKKCPELLIIHPNYGDYMYYTEKVKDIYREYSDRVESFGLDEAWIDLTHTVSLFGDPIKTAKIMQERVYSELGLSVSMGISFNKVFAKLGSDLDKRKGFTVISEDNYLEMTEDLSVDSLIFIGGATTKKLAELGITTIGELRRADPVILQRRFGKNGPLIWHYACGHENSPVKRSGETRERKSISHGITAVRDLQNAEDLHMILIVLCEAIAAKLRQEKLEGQVVSLFLRDNELYACSVQKKMSHPTDLAEEIVKNCELLMKQKYPERRFPEKPLRTVSVAVSNLRSKNELFLCDLLGVEKERKREETLESTMEAIRDHYGPEKVCRLAILMDRKLTDFHPKEEHLIHPESWM